ncbi:MAG: S9 family peptidase, partial [Bacteroidota bacterium]
MKHSIFPLILLLAACSSDPKSTPMPVADIAVPAYPETRKDTAVTDRYFGTEVADPYRWLENDTSEETGAWVKVQNEATYSYLDQLPDRERIKERLAEIWNYERYSTPYKKGPYYIFYKNDGVQNQSVVYLQEGLEGTPRVLIDPNQFSEDGTTALGTLSLSKDAKYAAYSVSVAGSDWQEIRVMEVATGKVLDDVIPWVKFSGISWFGDGFYYSRYDAPAGAEYSAKNEYHKVCYHQLGNDPAEDGIVFEDRDHPQRNFYAQTTEDEQYLIVYGAESTSGNALQFRNLTVEGSDWQVIDPKFEQEYRVIDHVDGRFLLHTNHSAPKNRVVAVDPANPTAENWTELIAEQEHVLEGITLANGKMVSQYLVDVSNRLYVHDMDGKQEGEIALPGLGIIGGFNADKDSPTAFYSFTNYTTPGSIYRYDMATDSAVVFQQPNIDFNPEDYETHQVFFTSKDGTKVPMFITHKKGLKMDGNNPTF